MKAISVFVAAFGVFAMVGCAAGAGEETSEAPTSDADDVVVEVENDKLTPACGGNHKASCGTAYCFNDSFCAGGVCRNYQPFYGSYIGTCQPY